MSIDPKIKQKANDIRTKIYGKEVRESLASGLEVMSEDVEDIKGRQESVESQFQAVLDETTGKDVISAPEILAARVSADGTNHNNLKERLDKEHQEVTSQLTHMENKKADKGEVRLKDVPISLNDIDSQLLAAIQNKEGETNFNLLTIPRDNSVDELKATFIERGKNLFNRKEVVVGYGLNASTGQVSPSQFNSYHRFRRVLPSTTYIKNWTTPSQVCFYDETKSFIGGITAQTFTTPENCYFIQFNVPGQSGFQGLQLEEGDVVTEYEDYYLKLKDSIFENLMTKDGESWEVED